MKTYIYKLFYSTLINKLYRLLLFPFKKFLNEKYKIPVVGQIRIKDLENNIQLEFYSNETCPMVRHLYWNDKNLNFEYSPIFKKIIKYTDVFLDVGANVGYYSVLAGKVNENTTIYSFEPSKGPQYFLKRNIELNKLEKAHFSNVAVDDEVGETDFYEEKNLKYPYLEYHASGIGNVENTWGITNFKKYKVKKTTLEKFVEENSLTKVDLIKIDTEGTEDRIIKGGLGILKKFEPVVICEVLNDSVAKNIDKILIDFPNYGIYQHKNESQELKKIATIFGGVNMIETNYFLIPVSKKDWFADVKFI